MKWRNIPSFPGYEASSTGLIRSKARIAERLHMGTPTRQPIRLRILKQWPRLSANGKTVCMMTGVSLKGINIVVRVHRLVLMAFKGPCPFGLVCCHKNGNPADNQIKNLRWDTQKSNSADAKTHGTYRKPPLKRGRDNVNAKLNEKSVRKIRSVPNYRGVGTDLSHIYGVSTTVIYGVRNRILWAWVSD